MSQVDKATLKDGGRNQDTSVLRGRLDRGRHVTPAIAEGRKYRPSAFPSHAGHWIALPMSFAFATRPKTGAYSIITRPMPWSSSRCTTKTTQKTPQAVLDNCKRRLKNLYESNFMKSSKKQRLEAAGFKVGSPDEFLGLTPEESTLVSLIVHAGRTGTQPPSAITLFARLNLCAALVRASREVANPEAAESDVSLLTC